MGSSFGWHPHRARIALRSIIVLSLIVVLFIATTTIGNADSSTEKQTSWPGNWLGRIEALALIETLNADLLSHDSATATLERWCADHRLAAEPQVTAERVPVDDPPLAAAPRDELRIKPDEAVRHRRVRLRCGDLVLSEADNWYVPARLTPEMNRLLDTSDMPFGKVVAALHFQRHTLSSALLWHPVPEGWEMTAVGAAERRAATRPSRLTIPSKLLEHRALLTLPDGTPISEVIETYTANVLGFSLSQHR